LIQGNTSATKASPKETREIRLEVYGDVNVDVEVAVDAAADEFFILSPSLSLAVFSPAQQTPRIEPIKNPRCRQCTGGLVDKLVMHRALGAQLQQQFYQSRFVETAALVAG
jgi:hypothetical protein